MNYKSLNILYVIASAALTVYLWGAVGPFSSWVFAAIACGLPQIISAIKNI